MGIGSSGLRVAGEARGPLLAHVDVTLECSIPALAPGHQSRLSPVSPAAPMASTG